MVVGLINPHDIMFYDATGEQAKHRMVHPDILGPLRREPGNPIYEVDNKFDLPESFYKDDLSTKPEAHSAIVRLNDLFYGPMPHDDEASWHRFNNYYYNCLRDVDRRSEEHTSELQSLMRISYAVFCLKKKNKQTTHK